MQLAVIDAHDDDSDNPDPAMLAMNCALNNFLLYHDLLREIAAAAKTCDFARLEALSTCCDQDIDNSAKYLYAFLFSRGTGLGDAPHLEDNSEMQRRAHDFAGPHAYYRSLFIFMDLLFVIVFFLFFSSTMIYTIISRETRKARHP